MAIDPSGPAVAENILKLLGKLRGTHTLEDFAESCQEYVRPVSKEYRGCRLRECAQAGKERLPRRLRAWLSHSILGVSVRSALTGSACTQRLRVSPTGKDAYLCDPNFSPVDAGRLISQTHLMELSSRVDLQRRIDDVVPAQMPEQ